MVNGSAPPARLADRLRAARTYAFVGRESELALFRRSLDAAPGDPGTASVLFLHGQGGIGKSTMLQRFEDEAVAAGRFVVHVKARSLVPSPKTLEEAAAVLAQDRALLLVDDFERCQGLEEWFHQRFLPQLPLGTLVCVAGRRPPGVRWRTDPGWRGALSVLKLDDLPPASAVELLRSEGVPAELYDPILAFAGGNPIALRLSAEVATHDPRHTMVWRPDRDVIGALLRHLVGEVPSPDHRRALEVCAHTFATTEELLAMALPDADTRQIFDWLRQQPYIDPCVVGVFPHDVVREALDSDLRWRDPGGYAELHQRVRAHVIDRARTATGADTVPAVLAFTHLHRSNGFVSRYLTWQGTGAVYEDSYRAEDHDRLVELARRAEGDESAAVAAFWLTERPEAFRVLRSSDTDRPAAFSLWLELDTPDDRHLAADPVIAACWQHSRATAQLRGGEHLAVARFLVHPDGHQRPSPVMDLMLHRVFAEFLRAERLAWSYIVLSDADLWRPFFSYIDQRAIDPSPSLDGRPHTLFAHDWRAVSVERWLSISGRLELSGPDPRSGRRFAAPVGELTVLTREEFDEAVREAFRNLHRAAELSANALSRSRLMANAPGADAVTRLRGVLTAAVDSLRDAPETELSHRVLQVTYLDTRRSQEAAAARLGVPYGTYRRRLQTALSEVTEHLWKRELYGPGQA